MDNNNDIRAQIEYGLDDFSADKRTVQIPLKELLYIYQTFGELVRFFHQTEHFKSLADITRFLGDKNDNAFAAINQCYNHILRDCWPPDVQQKFDEGKFDNPDLPFYLGPISDR